MPTPPTTQALTQTMYRQALKRCWSQYYCRTKSLQKALPWSVYFFLCFCLSRVRNPLLFNIFMNNDQLWYNFLVVACVFNVAFLLHRSSIDKRLIYMCSCHLMTVGQRNQNITILFSAWFVWNELKVLFSEIWRSKLINSKTITDHWLLFNECNKVLHVIWRCRIESESVLF